MSMPAKMPVPGTQGHLMAMPLNPLPEFSLDQTNLPAIKSWKVGSKYTLTMDVEMRSIGKDSMDKENELRARFKVLKVQDASQQTPTIKK